MKIVIVSSSLRTNSSSKQLAKIAYDVLSQTNDVEYIDLQNNHLEFCKGCLACQKNGKCVINDDMKKYLDVVSSSDVVILASPVYYYSISGQLKTFLDRLNPLYIKDNKFKKVYGIFTCADTESTAIEGPVKAIQGWVDCFKDVTYVDSFAGLDVNSTSDLEKHNYLRLVEEFAKRVSKED